jgi:acyl-CoA thioesterase
MSENKLDQKLMDLFKDDNYARLVGMELVEAGPGYSKVRMKVSADHHNFIGFVHGGAVFSLLDYAFSVASNSHNESAVAVSMSVQFVNASAPEGELIAEGREIEKSRKLGLYEMVVKDPDGKLIARSDGRVYRIGKPFVE